MSVPSRLSSAAGLLLMSAAVLRADVDPQSLPQVSYHPGGPV